MGTGRHTPGCAVFSLPPDAVGEVWTLTVQSPMSPGDGRRTGSGNEPRAACQEWDTAQQVSSREFGSPVGWACLAAQSTRWQILLYFLGIHLALTIPSRHTS